jgi:monoamine oxidase
MARSLYTRLNRRFGRPRPIRDRRAVAQARVQTLREQFPAALRRLPQAGAGAPPGRVAVVGAGFGGLTCAWALVNLGFEVRVYEARRRVGGRVHTLADLVPGRLIEAGAELIGLNHPAWIWLAQLFDLPFLAVTPESDFEGLGLEMPLYLGGRLLEPEEAERVWNEMDVALDGMVRDARAVDAYAPWEAERAAEWDATSLADWIHRLDVSDVTKDAIEAEMASNNGEPGQRQSYLANLALVSGGGGKDFWEDTELFKCATGNQSLAWALAGAVAASSPGSIRLDTPVEAIRVGSREVRVETAFGAEAADHVVLAVPPSAWSHIDIDPAIPEELHMNMGPTLKYLSAVDRRFWLSSGLAPYGTDDEIGETWEGTDNQTVSGDQGLELTLFAGGDAARRALEFQDPSGWYAAKLEAMYPGYSVHRRQTRFVPWPRKDWTWGGYSCPLPGQVCRVGPFLARPYHRRLVFAGEHACPAFFGYMEGALQSGLLAMGHVAEAAGLFSEADVVAALRAADRAAWDRIERSEA